MGSAGSVAQFVDNINRDVAGVTATLNSDGTIALSNNTGNDIVIGGTNASEAGFTSGTYTGYLSLASQNGSPVTVQAKDTANGYPGGAGTIMEVQSLGFNQTADGASFKSGQVTTGALTASDDVRINGVKVGPSTDGSALAKAAAINAISSQTGVTATASTQVLATLDFTSIPAATDVQINGSTVDLSAVKNLSDVVTGINNAGINGLTASANDQGQLVLTSTTGANVTISDAGSFFSAAKTQDGQSGTGSFAAGLTFGGEITLSSTTGASIQVQNVVSGSAAKLGLAQQGGSGTLVGGALSVATQADAQTAIKAIDAAIDKVSLNRGNLGAVQNRLQATVTNLQQISTNLTSARSAVQDTDFSMETTELAKQQILSQAASAMLAQANQTGQQVLHLLQQ